MPREPTARPPTGPSPTPQPITVRSVEAIALEAPLPRTVETPMARIASTVSLLVVVTDVDGVEGWGEVWCNFPRFGLHHRARLVREVLAPALAGHRFARPAEAFARLARATRLLRLQSGEPGPIAAAVAGIDIALHDLEAKRAGQPLWRRLGGRLGRVEVYASPGRGTELRPTVEACLARGFRALKLHATGGVAEQLAVVRPIRELVGPGVELMLDVDASCEPGPLIAGIDALAQLRLAWLEEPLPADAPDALWRRRARAAPMPLACGENFLEQASFERAIAEGSLGVLQPDVTKWGGITLGLPLARRIVAAGRRFCPNMFSGAPGLLAAAHLLAASGSPDGWLELAVGRQPLRDPLLGGPPGGGPLELGEAPGLGLEVDRRLLARYRIG
jgi:L-alanine-DL-glutamate epimerase-like enolase superfamily enzyme